ncbi:class I SAM-dependent methyltransferase (plasmid) [Piscirickettsia salmonis]|nr:class I SAM-dependent methyltransferase [Piscirickettsia salmonis]
MITDVSGLGFDLYDVIYNRLYFMYIQNYVELLKQVLNQLKKVGGIIFVKSQI